MLVQYPNRSKRIGVILANGAVISGEHRGLAVANAATRGYGAIIADLLANGAAIPDKHRDTAIAKARENGHEAIITILSQSIPRVDDRK